MGEIRTSRIVSFSWSFFFLLAILDSVGQFWLRCVFRRMVEWCVCVCVRACRTPLINGINIFQFGENKLDVDVSKTFSPFSCRIAFSGVFCVRRIIFHILPFVFSFVCSTKHLKVALKENSSPFFLETDGKNPVCRYIYNLLTDGIKGNAKKDTLLAILHEIAVSSNLASNLRRSKIQIQLFFSHFQ